MPAEVFANAAELLLKLGHTEDARRAVDLALRECARRGTPTPIVSLRSQLGRVLCRLGELERARPLLERALAEGDPADERARAGELAWLCRAVLERVEDLRDRQRERAARELLGRFMVTFAPHFRRVERSPEAGGGVPSAAEDEAWRWSLYYVNFRLGRLFALASELAGHERGRLRAAGHRAAHPGRGASTGQTGALPRAAAAAPGAAGGNVPTNSAGSAW